VKEGVDLLSGVSAFGRSPLKAAGNRQQKRGSDPGMIRAQAR
jgi:hypothetical protein